MLKHENIAIFVPNNGCPHMCSFCDQFKITGKMKQPGKADIDEAIENSEKKPNDEKRTKIFRELAFFGGSFTAIEKSYMKNLLIYAHEHIKTGKIDGIRISTRPDCINEEILDLLKFYGVTSIELGAQSMVDRVLLANNRGHNARDVVNSSKMIKEYGFELGLQMMTGLYMSEAKDDLFTAKEFVKIRPHTVRIYPTLIMKGTKLHELYDSGNYIPMDIDDAVELCSKILELFNVAGINVIRLGLHGSDGINRNLVAGPWHPAFKELCESKIMVDKCIELIRKLNCEKKDIKIIVSPKDVSKITGHKRRGIKRIENLCPNVVVEQDSGVKVREFLLKVL